MKTIISVETYHLLDAAIALAERGVMPPQGKFQYLKHWDLKSEDSGTLADYLCLVAPQRFQRDGGYLTDNKDCFKCQALLAFGALASEIDIYEIFLPFKKGKNKNIFLEKTLAEAAADARAVLNSYSIKNEK